MDEPILFERIHDALDMEPRPGAYERLRIALAKGPAKPQRWPAFEMRWPGMGLKLAAGLALLALAAAIVAALLAAHNGTVGSVPAGSGLTTKAYQKLVGDDYAKSIATWSDPCDTTQHAGCQGDANRAIAALQQWLDDLNRSQPPARFLVVDAQLRLHLTQSVSGLYLLLAASQAQDQDGMNRAYLLALAGRQWTDTVLPTVLVSSQQRNVAAYKVTVRAQKQYLDQCIKCQDLVGQNTMACSQNQTPNCQDLLDGTAIQIASFQSELVAFAPPGALSAKDGRLQEDLAQADTALIAMSSALSAGDQAGFNAGRIPLQRAVAAVVRDATDISNS